MIPRTSLLKISVNYYLRYRIQSVLLVLGIALGVAVIVAIDIANSSARNSFDKSLSMISTNVTHSVHSSNTVLGEELYFHLRKEVGYTNIAPVIERFIYIDQLPDEQFKIIGIDPFSENSQLSLFNTHNIGLNSKTFELFFTEVNGAIISNKLLHILGHDIGDTFSIGTDKKRAIKIVGTIDTSGYENLSFSKNTILVDISTAQSLLNYNGRLSRIDLNLGGYSVKKIEEIKTFLNSEFPGTSLIRSDSLNEQSAKLARSFELNLTALSLITLLIAFFLIYNSFNYSLVVRRPVFSILRSIGVTSREIFYLILSEALIIGLLSSILGIVLGVVLGEFSVRLVSNTLSSIYSVFSQSEYFYSYLSLIKAVLIGISAVLAAAFIPSIESRYIKPVSLLRGTYFSKGFTKLIPYLFITGIFISVTGLYISTLVSQSIRITFVGLFLIIIGYTLLLPALMLLIAKLLNLFAKSLFGKVYLIPCRNYISSIDKNYVATASLSVAVAVFLSMTVLIESFRSTLNVWLSRTFSSDVFISAVSRPGENRGLDYSLLEIVSEVKGASDLGYSRKINLLTEDYGRINLIALGDNPPIKPQIISGVVNESVDLKNIKGNPLLVSESFSNRYKNKMKDGYIHLPTGNGIKNFLIAGVFSDFATQTATVIMDYDLFRTFWDDDKITSISLNISNGFELSNVLNRTRKALPEGTEYRISTNKDLRDSANNIFNQTFAITNAMRIIAFAVAFFGILGALLALELSRKKEIGVLRSIGVRAYEIRKIILTETGIIGMLSGVVSIPLGLIVAYLLVYVINFKSFGWTIDFLIKPVYLIEAVFISVVAALLAGIYPSIIFSKINISEAIREE